jgi:hypothetical protein
VPRFRTAATTAAVHNVVDGDCGESWILVWDDVRRAGQYDVDTGFSVNGPGGSYQWVVHVEKSAAPRMNREHHSGGDLRGRWGTSFSVQGQMFQEGNHRATVVPAKSFVILADGGVCYSGGPWDEAYIR